MTVEWLNLRKARDFRIAFLLESLSLAALCYLLVHVDGGWVTNACLVLCWWGRGVAGNFYHGAKARGVQQAEVDDDS